MQTVTEVEQIILNLVQPVREQELLPLNRSISRILAAPITSNLDFPYWDNSAMDGYAVRFEDVKNASAAHPITLDIIEEIPAGYCPQKQITSTQSARIYTGGMMPDGADTIVIQENTRREGQQVTILSAPNKNDFIRFRGSFYRAGDILLPAGIRINPPEMAILATAQCVQVPVVRSPVIAILSTGNELITPEQTLQPGQIIDSNQYLLSSFLTQNGVTALPLGIVPDNFEALKKAIANALAQADWVISTGGVSVGEYDYVDRVLEQLGGEIKVKNVKMKPGKPLTVASFAEQKLYFGIPGNPVSTMVTCWRFLQTAIAKLAGQINYSLPKIVDGITNHELRSQGSRETYLWGYANLVNGHYHFHLAQGSSSSGNLINLKEVNALAIVPIGTTLIASNSHVKIMLI